MVTGLLPGQVEVAYTLYGDANLDFKVNGTDFSIMAANFNQYAPNWDQGDFNYANVVNGRILSSWPPILISLPAGLRRLPRRPTSPRWMPSPSPMASCTCCLNPLLSHFS